MSTDDVVDKIHDIYEECMAALHNQRYQELLFFVDKRSQWLELLADGEFLPTSDQLQRLARETEEIDRHIRIHIANVENAVTHELATADARRSYARSIVQNSP